MDDMKTITSRMYAFEGATAVYREGSILGLVSVENVKVTTNGISADITTIPVKGLFRSGRSKAEHDIPRSWSVAAPREGPTGQLHFTEHLWIAPGLWSMYFDPEVVATVRRLGAALIESSFRTWFFTIRAYLHAASPDKTPHERQVRFRTPKMIM
jgi:hypothetical protein